jgi:hypothetical protein
VLRSSVVASIVLHGALVAVAMTLPDPPSRRERPPIEIEVRTPLTKPEPPPKKEEEPKPPPVTPPPQKVAIRTPPERTAPPRERAPVEPPPVTPPPTSQPQPPSPPKEEPKPPEKPRSMASIDLRLHTLPSGAPSNGVILAPSNDSQFGLGGTVNSAPTAKPGWRPRGDAGDPITGKIAEKKEERFPLARVGRDEYVYKGPQFSARILPDGTVNFDDKTFRDFNGTSGSFDLTDMIMRGKKEDPYRHEKQAFLASTEALRTQLQKKARAERLRGSLAMLPQHLENIWFDRRLPAKRRRQLLFELWRDVAAGDDDEGKAGSEARRIVESFVRKHLPEGSEEAYTEDELATLNRGHKDRFQPY